jgi:hypothetical protein
MKAKENEFDYLEVARKTKAEYDEGKLTIPQIIEVMRPTTTPLRYLAMRV